jgi:hypothetical protein
LLNSKDFLDVLKILRINGLGRKSWAYEKNEKAKIIEFVAEHGCALL